MRRVCSSSAYPRTRQCSTDTDCITFSYNPPPLSIYTLTVPERHGYWRRSIQVRFHICEIYFSFFIVSLFQLFFDGLLTKRKARSN